MKATEITVRDLKRAGLVHTPELDFSDDGTNFKMFTYKGVPVSYTKVHGDYYISIRFDYIDGLGYETYSKFPSYSLANDFNGVDFVDMDELVKNLEAAAADLK